MIRSSLNLANKRELVLLSDLVSDIRSNAPAAEVLLVGAAARDLLLYHAHGITAARRTEDIDLAFAVDGWSDYETFRDSLLDSGVFRPHPAGVHKLLYRGQIEVDLIPFGGLENADGAISWPPNGDMVMSVLGFEEALIASIDVHLPGGSRISVVSTPMLAVLKILAWSERTGAGSQKDAFDLLLILRNYLDAGNQDRLYTEADHLLENPGFDYERAGAWLAGKDALEAIQGNSRKTGLIEKTLRSILAAETDPVGRLRLVGEVGDRDPEQSRRILSAFLSGFAGEPTPG